MFRAAVVVFVVGYEDLSFILFCIVAFELVCFCVCSRAQVTEANRA